MVDAASQTVLPALATTFRLALVVVVASAVGNQINEPSSKLCTNQVSRGHDRGFFHQLGHFVSVIANSRGILFAGLRKEDHITFEVAGGLVVLAVGDLPRKVWNQHGGMADKADRVVQGLRWRERLVSTLVCQYPETSPK